MTRSPPRSRLRRPRSLQALQEEEVEVKAAQPTNEELEHDNGGADDDDYDDKDLPAGWERLQDEGTGEFYFYNDETHESLWTKPKKGAQDKGSESSAAAGNDVDDI